MERRTFAELLIGAVLLTGALAFAIVQGSLSFLLKDRVVTYRLTLGVLAPESTRSATGTAETLPEPDYARPVAVMIDNHPAAFPQTGVSKATEVWQMPVEGGLTRLMAVFKTDSTEKIGPVRSARPYFVELAASLDAVYVHVGGSDEALRKLAAGGGVDDVNEFKFGNNFWRDRVRSAPHNTYTSNTLIDGLINLHRWREMTEVDPVRRSIEVPAGTPAAAATITPTLGGQAETFAYDAASRTWRRSLNGKPVGDEDRTQHAPRTLVALELEQTKIADPQGKGLIGLATVGSGKATVFRDGVAVVGTWRRAAGERLRIFDETKNEIPFAPGQVWYFGYAANKGGKVEIN
jgi:hypothetical protein